MLALLVFVYDRGFKLYRSLRRLSSHRLSPDLQAFENREFETITPVEKTNDHATEQDSQYDHRLYLW